MEIAILAAGAVSLLNAFLSKAGETFAQKAGEDIFKRVSAFFSRKPGLQEAVADLKQKPDDPDRAAVVRVQLRKLLEDDPALAQNIERILKAAEEKSSRTTIVTQTARDNAIQIGEINNGNADLSRRP